MTTDTYDLIIVGGGMVGASLAITLADRGLRMALIEAHAPGVDSQPSYDDRGIALAYGTRRIFDAIGVWSALESIVEPILDIHVSDRGHFGFTGLSAAAWSQLQPHLAELARTASSQLADAGATPSA